jgi:hypothetical protein
MNPRELSNRQQFGMVLITLCTGLPGVLIAGYVPEIGNLLPMGPLGWLALSAFGTAIGASLYVPKAQYWYVGFLSGLIGGPGALLATYFYSSWRTSMYSIEIVLSSAVGGQAGILMYKLWYSTIAGAETASKETGLTAATMKQRGHSRWS